MKLLVDMNLSPRWVAYLREAQFHSEHWSEVGSAQAVDAEIMAYAAEHDYVVLTNDLDFGAILAATRGGKPSVIQVRSRNLDPAFIGVTVVQALLQLEKELRAGALLTVEEASMRVRLLPLNRDE
jgi:predicted nuclease of predicted toxin-antitoxin system